MSGGEDSRRGGLARRLDAASRARAWARGRGAARRGYLVGRRLAARAGVQILIDTYDSPIPREATLAADFFARPSPLRGIDLALDRQAALLQDELAPFLAEFRPPHGPDRAAGGFYLDNGTFGSVDAELLYAIVRWSRPRRIIELGSGFSTLVVEAALRRPGAAVTAQHDVFDPYPSSLLDDVQGIVVRTIAAEHIYECEFRELEAGDVVFVDTSHTVRVGGDVNRIVLDLLPLLAPGVIVHFHDVFLPWHYSRGHLRDAHFWAEQYLVQAFLAYNERFEVLCAAQALARERPDLVGRLIPSFAPGVSPGSFWIRRTGS